jgi:hypothetical protein
MNYGIGYEETLIQSADDGWHLHFWLEGKLRASFQPSQSGPWQPNRLTLGLKMTAGVGYPYSDARGPFGGLFLLSLTAMTLPENGHISIT